MYADVHSAAEKTNRGGQQLAPPPAGLTYIQQSSGYALKKLVDPAVPDGYELVFGPKNGANNAPEVRRLLSKPRVIMLIVISTVHGFRIP